MSSVWLKVISIPLLSIVLFSKNCVISLYIAVQHDLEAPSCYSFRSMRCSRIRCSRNKINNTRCSRILHSPATCDSITKTEYGKGDDEEEYILSDAQRGSGKNISGGKQALCSAV